MAAAVSTRIYKRSLTSVTSTATIPPLLQATEQTNEEQANNAIRLAQTLIGPLDSKRIAILGLSFKKDTDDIREAASIRVIGLLRKMGRE